MIRKAEICLLCLVLAGCGSAAQKTDGTASSTAPAAVQKLSVSYDDYSNAIKNAVTARSYTAGVKCAYDMHYSDNTMDAFDMDAVLEYDGSTSDVNAHLNQNIDSNGTKSTMDGYYYGGRLYNTYNSVTYYEDMDVDGLLSSVLVPLSAKCYDKDDIKSLSGTQEGSKTVYTLTLDPKAADDIFSSRYDSYGLKDYDDFNVTSGTVKDTFDKKGRLANETADFTISVSYESQKITVDYSSEVSFSRLDSTSVTITDDMKKSQASYVNYRDIDTSSIKTITDDDDSAEATVTDTFRKRLVSRLNYNKGSDGLYTLEFNNGNESYQIDFSRHTFLYAERSIKYSYNWKSDVGSMGSCTVDFSNDSHRTSECKDSTADTIEQVKTYFEMELYYCGLTLADLQAEG